MRKKSAIDYRAPARTPSGVRNNESYASGVQEYSDTTPQIEAAYSSNDTQQPGLTKQSTDSTNIPAYSKVTPKSQRQQQGAAGNDEYDPVIQAKDDEYDPVIMATDDGDYDDYTQDDYDEIGVASTSSRLSSSTSSTTTQYLELPHPRLELTAASAFDKIRLFLARNRGPNEVFKTSSDVELGGVAIENLRRLLNELDSKEVAVEKRSTTGKTVDNGRVISTHL